jgi:NADH-quinone oxidoreductase subunit M
MEWFDSHILSILIFMPLFWGATLLFLPSKGPKSNTFLRVWALLGSLAIFVISTGLYTFYDPMGAAFQFRETYEWIPKFGITYSLGIDGISLWLILLTTFLTPIVILATFKSVETRVKEFYFLFLFLESGMLGAFMALDVFLFYVFWEAMLIPMYFLIGIWGGKERVYAAMKFFLFTVVGSLLMLVAIFYLAYLHKVYEGHYSTLITNLYAIQIDSLSTQSFLFLAFALAFAIKVPLFPFHTWLPDAHVQAPTAGSVILAGVLLKLGGYGFIRFAFPLFPDALFAFQIPFMALGALAVTYGAWVAMVQPDIKKLVAYSSVSHMGFIIIGLFAMNSVAVTGSIYQMLNHGISTGALFLLVGMIYERRHTRQIKDFGGISKVMPLFAVSFLIISLSSIGLPGTNGFVGEFLVLLGTWKVSPWITAFAALGVIFGAVYMLWMFQRVMFGKITNKANETLKDLSLREICVIAPLIFAVFFMGLYPNFFFKKMEPSVNNFLQYSISKRKTSVEETAVGKKENKNGNRHHNPS